MSSPEAIQGFSDSLARFNTAPFLLFVLFAMGLTLCAMGACGCSPALTPCSPTDLEGNAKFLECRARIAHECKHLSDDECPVIPECESYAMNRCAP